MSVKGRRINFNVLLAPRTAFMVPPFQAEYSGNNLFEFFMLMEKTALYFFSSKLFKD